MSKQTRANNTLREDQKQSARRKPEQAAGPAPAGAHLQRLPDNPAAASTNDVAAMQSRYGNRAVQRLLGSHTIQAKLEVGPAGDRYEQEADRVARQVMRMPAEPTKDEEEEKP